MRMRMLVVLAAVAGLVAPAVAAPAPALKLERVVMLMRHGIRPPTSANVTPAGIADQAWPSWTTPYGELTAHGAQAVEILGRADRAAVAKRGLLPVRGCPAAGTVVLYADSDQRTIATGEALSRGLAPGCTLDFGHKPQGDLDTLFSPLETPGPLDPAKAEAAARAAAGDLSSFAASRSADLRLAQRILAPNCQTATCNLSAMRSGIETPEGEGRPKATGPLDFLPTAAQSLMLLYVEGRPMSEVGWGRVSPAQLTQMMSWHSLKSQVLQRPTYIAAHGSANILAHMLSDLQASGPLKLSVLVGHDTNISDLGGTLNLHWQVPSYPADTPPPGGALGFELLRDAGGRRYVRAFYRSQSMDQMRNLSPLSGGAYRQVLPIPGCAQGPEATCPLADFVKLAAEAINTPR